MGIIDDETLFLSGLADDGERAALALAKLAEDVEARGRHREDVAFLGLVAPDLERRHAGLVIGQLAQVEFPTAAGVVDELGQGVGNATGADVVDEADGIVRAERPAAVDNLLATAFHLGVVALHAGEIEVLVARAAADGAGGTAAQAD